MTHSPCDGPPAVFVVCLSPLELDLLGEVFANPRYKNSGQLIHLEEHETEVSPQPNQVSRIVLVDRSRRACVPPPISETFQAHLRMLEDQPVANSDHKILVPFAGHPLAGLHPEIRQLITTRELAEAFFDIRDSNLSDNAIDWMVNQGRPNLATFFKANEDPIRHFLRVFDRTPDTEQEILLWVVRRHAPPGSYLAWVLHDTPNSSSANIRCRYVTAATNTLDNAIWATERQTAINQAEPARSIVDIQHFIRACSDESTNRVAPWLNCGSDSEKIDLIRRCAVDGIVTNAAKAVYPELTNYMSPDTSFGTPELDAYFADYRALKLTDRVTPEFFDKAYSARIPNCILSRDALVQKYVGDTACALLVVDACGAEYLPMLVAMARIRGVVVVSAAVATAHLPTATAFNTVIWPDTKRRLQPNVQRMDNIAHHGSEAHEAHSSAENLMAELEHFKFTSINRKEIRL